MKICLKYKKKNLCVFVEKYQNILVKIIVFWLFFPHFSYLGFLVVLKKNHFFTLKYIHLHHWNIFLALWMTQLKKVLKKQIIITESNLWTTKPSTFTIHFSYFNFFPQSQFNLQHFYKRNDKFKQKEKKRSWLLNLLYFFSL